MDAQHLPIYSQYLFNKYLINPAVAGSDGYTSINLTTRQQWTGYQGAPQTYSLSFQGRVLKQKYVIKDNIFNKKIFKPQTQGKVGLGGTVYSDINGLVRRTGFSTSYAYHIWLHGGHSSPSAWHLQAIIIRWTRDRFSLKTRMNRG